MKALLEDAAGVTVAAIGALIDDVAREAGLDLDPVVDGVTAEIAADALGSLMPAYQTERIHMAQGAARRLGWALDLRNPEARRPEYLREALDFAEDAAKLGVERPSVKLCDALYQPRGSYEPRGWPTPCAFLAVGETQARGTRCLVGWRLGNGPAERVAVPLVSIHVSWEIVR